MRPLSGSARHAPAQPEAQSCLVLAVCLNEQGRRSRATGYTPATMSRTREVSLFALFAAAVGGSMLTFWASVEPGPASDGTRRPSSLPPSGLASEDPRPKQALEALAPHGAEPRTFALSRQLSEFQEACGIAPASYLACSELECTLLVDWPDSPARTGMWMARHARPLLREHLYERLGVSGSTPCGLASSRLAQLVGDRRIGSLHVSDSKDVCAVLGTGEPLSMDEEEAAISRAARLCDGHETGDRWTEAFALGQFTTSGRSQPVPRSTPQ